MQLQVESLVSSHSNCTPLILGDMNATARDNDRTSGAMYPSDRRYRSFLSSNNLSPCIEDSIRTWTHCRATGRDCNNNTTYTFSRIDNIILHNDLATQCPPCHTCKLGGLSDHIPLPMTIPTSTLKIHIPILNNIPPPKSCPRKILSRPVNDSDRLTFLQSLQDPAYGVTQELEDLLNTLNPAHEEAIAFLSNLDHENARNTARFHSICKRPAAEAVEDMASSVADIIHSLSSCTENLQHQNNLFISWPL